jgi:hypothetical protein
MDDIDIISSQTGIEDKELIERVYLENNKSTPDTIMRLMKYDYCKEFEIKPRTVFDDIRIIVAEKEDIFMELMNRNKKQTSE